MCWKTGRKLFGNDPASQAKKIFFFLLRCPAALSKSPLIGSLAQLVERFVYTEDVGSSSLSRPTIPTLQIDRDEMPFGTYPLGFFYLFQGVAGKPHFFWGKVPKKPKHCLTVLRGGNITAQHSAAMLNVQRAVVAQLVRVPACHAGGRGFEPRQPRHCCTSSWGKTGSAPEGNWTGNSPPQGENAVVAQLVRVPACHAGGRGFEPRQPRHFRLPSWHPRIRPGGEHWPETVAERQTRGCSSAG